VPPAAPFDARHVTATQLAGSDTQNSIRQFLCGNIPKGHSHVSARTRPISFNGQSSSCQLTPSTGPYANQLDSRCQQVRYAHFGHVSALKLRPRRTQLVTTHRGGVNGLLHTAPSAGNWRDREHVFGRGCGTQDRSHRPHRLNMFPNFYFRLEDPSR
jgi:hypothetical protein